MHFSRKRSSPGVLLSTEMRSGALNTKRDPMINFETHHIVIAKGKLFSITTHLNIAFHQNMIYPCLYLHTIKPNVRKRSLEFLQKRLYDVAGSSHGARQDLR